MKSATDPRHKIRQKIVQELFASSFATQPVTQKTKEILKDQKKLDIIIKKAAPDWPIEKINKIDLAILRLAIWEILEDKAPKKVIIDEAIELGKEYGGETSPGFINGVLGTVIK